MTMDSNDNKTVGLPPNMMPGPRKVARPGAEPPPAPVAKPPSGPVAKVPPERPAVPVPPAKPLFGARKPTAAQEPLPARPPENPWNETVLPPSPSLKKGQLPPRQPAAAEESSWFGPGAGLAPLPPHAEPAREIPAIPEPRLEARRQPHPQHPQPHTPIKSPPPVRDIPGTQTMVQPGRAIAPEMLAEGVFLSIKVCTEGAGWKPLTTLRVTPAGQVIGRNMPDAAWLKVPSFAPEHFRLSWSEGRLQIEEAKTINGVYLRLKQGCKVLLADGARFVIGPHVLEFRAYTDTASANTPVTSPDGEVFRSVAVKPLAYLDILGPNAKPSLRVPLTKPDFTDIGRYGGDKSDIVLSDDELVSRHHARITHDSGKFYLEDRSTNGTFVRIRGKQVIDYGPANKEELSDHILAGELALRFVEI
ncbi:MAG: FHA domain-containing protein [Isosphaeraceae bacterium]